MKNMFEQPTFEAIKPKELSRNEQILAVFAPEQQIEIENKRKILSSLAFYIGKDFSIPVELNEPGAGWHWDFKNNIIRVDARDLLEKPMDYLRFVISHEGGHRRISRTDFIPLEVWNQPGFSFLMNAIEDPRDNNFVAENYPQFREQMEVAYRDDLDIEVKSIEKAKAKLGYQPRFMQAGFEYIRQWFREVRGEAIELSADLPSEVREVVQATIENAQDSWWCYPSKEEADGSEAMIGKYAEASYRINLEKIWPEFKKLVEKDQEDQQMQEFMKDMAQEKMSEQESLSDDNAGGSPIDFDSLSDDDKQKIKDMIDTLSDEQKKELSERAAKALGEFGKEISKDLSGKLSEDPASAEATEGKSYGDDGSEVEDKSINPETDSVSDIDEARIPADREQERIDREKSRKKMESVLTSENSGQYFKTLTEVAPLIDNLTGELRDIFIKRKLHKFESGHRFGRRWNIPKRIAEKIAGIPLLRTESREQIGRKSEEKDYAITLMIDLSGSMNGAKIKEAFKSAIVLAETLASLNIRFEVVGFQDILLEFKSFDDALSDEMRMKLDALLREVANNNPGGHNNSQDNDDGTCLAEASEHLEKERAQNKFLIVLSDGQPAMDSGRKSQSQLKRELKAAIKNIEDNTKQKLIGIGLLSSAVSNYYKNNLPDVTTKDIVMTIGEVLRGIIEDY